MEPDEDGVTFVTFEFDAVDGPAFKAQCRAWLDEGVVVEEVVVVVVLG